MDRVTKSDQKKEAGLAIRNPDQKFDHYKADNGNRAQAESVIGGRDTCSIEGKGEGGENEHCYHKEFRARRLCATHPDQRSTERNSGNCCNDIAKRQRRNDDGLPISSGRSRTTPAPAPVAALRRITPRKKRADFCHSPHPLLGCRCLRDKCSRNPSCLTGKRDFWPTRPRSPPADAVALTRTPRSIDMLEEVPLAAASCAPSRQRVS